MRALICEQTCKECQHVLNMEESSAFIFWKWFDEAISYRWKCGSKIKADCRYGTTEFEDCWDNYGGKCPRYSRMDTKNYNPKEHLITKEA